MNVLPLIGSRLEQTQAFVSKAAEEKMRSDGGQIAEEEIVSRTHHGKTGERRRRQWWANYPADKGRIKTGAAVEPPRGTGGGGRGGSRTVFMEPGHIF